MSKYIDVDKVINFVYENEKSLSIRYGSHWVDPTLNILRVFKEDSIDGEVIMDGSLFRCSVCKGVITSSLNYAENVHACPFCGVSLYNKFYEDKVKQKYEHDRMQMLGNLSALEYSHLNNEDDNL